MSVPSKDDPAQSSFPPCAVSFCLVSLYQLAETRLVYSTGKCSTERLPAPKLHPLFCKINYWVFYSGYYITKKSLCPTQNTSPLFKPTRQLPCFNSEVVPDLSRFEHSCTIYYYTSSAVVRSNIIPIFLLPFTISLSHIRKCRQGNPGYCIPSQRYKLLGVH